jgi:hypothetical protein
MAKLTRFQRHRIVALDHEGFSALRISKSVNCSSKTVQFWIRRHSFTGSTEPIPPPGRECLLDDAARKRALELLLSGQSGGARFVARALLAEKLTKKLVSANTVLRGAKREAIADGDELKCFRGRPPKALTPLNRTQRVSFAKNNQKTNWSRVLITDRCKFHFRFPGCKVSRCRWMLRSKKHQDGACKPNRPSVYNVYGGISMFGTTKLHPVTGTSKLKTNFKNLKGQASRNITTDEYKHVLMATLLPEGGRIFSGKRGGPWVLQQDGDPTHKRAPSIIKQYKRMGGGGDVSLLPMWPGNSPDLSPIENVWAYVDAEVAQKGCKTFEEFKAAVDKTFHCLPKSMCQNLMKSMPNRLERCVALEGAKIGY